MSGPEGAGLETPALESCLVICFSSGVSELCLWR